MKWLKQHYLISFAAGFGILFFILRGINKMKDLNNPGNVKKTTASLDRFKDKLSADQSNSEYLIFNNKEGGVYGMASELLYYQAIYGEMSVRGMINIYTPNDDPDVIAQGGNEAYIQFICKNSGLDPAIPFKFGEDSLKRMVNAMIIYENGYQRAALYTDPIVTAGVNTALKDYA